MTTRSYEQVILVDAHDRAIGTEEKLKAHREGKLHRAFSIFVFNDRNEFLLQRRALHKYHCGGLWTNTCCSHPRPEEELADASQRRLLEEMGISCPLTKAFDFVYKSAVGKGLVEHEFDHVFVGRYSGEVYPNPEEVMDHRWRTAEQVKVDLLTQPRKYTPWFRIAFEKVLQSIPLAADWT